MIVSYKDKIKNIKGHAKILTFKEIAILFYLTFTRRLIVVFALVFLLISNSSPVLSKTKVQIAVLYPESNTRASQLYKTIIKSMASSGDVKIISKKFTKKSDGGKITQWLTSNNAQAVVFLGKQGITFSKKLSLDIPIITGAHIGMPLFRPAVSLTADPLQLFTTLKKLRPNIKTVNVIYNMTNNEWLMKNARKAAEKNNIVLKAIPVDTVHDSGPALTEMVRNIDIKNDAIWLPYDPVIPVKALLPKLLEKAWRNDITIFSGNPYHVQQGTLFALFPDYSKLGWQLVELTLRKLEDKDLQGYEPSRYLSSAINIRTASHLGIHLSSTQIENYKMVFPTE